MSELALEVVADLVVVAATGECKLQLHTRLDGVEEASRDGVACAVRHNSTDVDLGRHDDGDTTLLGHLYVRCGAVCNVASTSTGEYNALRAVVHGLFDQLEVVFLVAVNDVDHGEFANAGAVEGLLESGLARRPVVEGLVAEEPTNVTLLRGAKGVENVSISTKPNVGQYLQL